MDFENSLAYVSYNFYNWLAIHNAPEKVLDFFIPFLCVYSTKHNFIYFFANDWLRF